MEMNFMLKTFFVFLNSFIIVETFHQDIYNGGHLHDVLCDSRGTRVIRRSGVLVMTSDTDRWTLDRLGWDRDRMPLKHYVAFMEYDYARPSQSWYKYTDDEDLAKKFGIKKSPTFMFFHKGQSIDSMPTIWNGEGDVAEWVWSMLKTKVKVINEYGKPIEIHVTGYGPLGASQPHILQPEERVELDTYLSFKVTAIEHGISGPGGVTRSKFIRGWLLNQGSLVIPISPDMTSPTTEEVWLHAAAMDEWRQSNVSTWENWSDARRELIVLKQPQLVPRFTEKGYHLTRMPEKLWTALKKFRDENLWAKQPEYWIAGETQINQNDVRCSLLNLTLDMKMATVEILQPILESWCECKLEFTVMFGLREYHHLSTLKRHLDRVDTHIVSVVLQVDQDMGDAEDWKFEVIDWSGRRVNMKVTPGDMVMYESARLPHARAKPLQGKAYMNAFLHFQPVGWDMHLNNDHEFEIGDKRVPLVPLQNGLRALNNDHTWNNNRRFRDEL